MGWNEPHHGDALRPQECPLLQMGAAMVSTQRALGFDGSGSDVEVAVYRGEGWVRGWG